MRLAPLDISIIVLYFCVSLAVGLWLTRRASSSVNEYFLSGRSLPWWLAGTSMVATTFSSDTPLYITALVRGHGVYENWQWWCFILSGMLAVSFFSRLWRRAEVLTDVELIDIRYSGRAANVLRGFKAVYFSCAIHTIIKAQVILSMVKILDVTVGWGKWESVIVSSLITLVYSVMSGYWGVVVTDFIQFIVAMVGAVVLAVVAVDRAGGLSAMTAALPEKTLAFFPPVFDGGGLSLAFMAFLGYAGLSWWSKYSSDGGGVIVQRISSCRTEREGYAAAFVFNIANYGLRTWPWVLAALASIVIMPTVSDHEAVYPMMVMELLPTGLVGLMLASFFAAFMSTLSTYLNLSSSYFVNDFYRPFVSPQRDEAHYVFVSRAATVGLSVITALVTVQLDSIVWAFKFLIAFGSGTGLVYIVRWFWWRVNAWSEISAMLSSTVMSVVAYFWLTDLSYSGKLALIISVSTFVWVVVTLITPPTDRAKLEGFVRRVRPGGPGWEPMRRAAGVEAVQGESLWALMIEWIAGCILVGGVTIGVGKLLLGSPGSGMFSLAVSAIAGVYIWRRFQAMGSSG